jgi:nucleoid DNA-binding protein
VAICHCKIIIQLNLKGKVMSKKTAKKGKKVVKKVAVKKAKSVCSVSIRPIEVKSPFGKSQIAGTIAGMVCVSKKDAALMIDALFEIISSHLKRRGPGIFTLPGLAKFRVVNKPAVKAHQGINPFTGQSMMFAAKPARNVVKVRPLKKLKDLAK